VHKGAIVSGASNEDALWPRAAALFRPASDGIVPECDVALLGVPAHETSISATGADSTPAAVRAALSRFSTFSTSAGLDLAELSCCDIGDVSSPDGSDGETRVAEAVARARDARLLVAVGGDNSLTYSVMRARVPDLGRAGLITLDIHHDLRDGVSNGSPVRRLIEAGLDGRRVVQLGIADFSNSPAYAARARELGITVVPLARLAEASETDLATIAARALTIAAAGGGHVHLDVDVDVCDRSVAPACPASAPGGLSAARLRRLVALIARDKCIRSVDIAEVDASADAADGRTVRLAALLVLEAAGGLLLRGRATGIA
jgi:formiminoglutamase